METAKLSPGTLIAVISALVLLILMSVVDWFGSSGSSVDLPPEFLGVKDVGFNAWESFTAIDIVLLITIVVAIGSGLIEGTSRRVNSPVVIESVICSFGIVSCLLLLFRIVDPPGDLNREVGVYLGLLASFGIAYGGWRAMADEGTSFTDQARRL